jgi:hypothetical protein
MEWDEFIDDAGGGEDLADLDTQIAFAEMHLALLRSTRALRELGMAMRRLGEFIIPIVEDYVLSSDVIDDEGTGGG